MEFYIAASVFLLLAIVTATGKIDNLYTKKYAPVFKDGKFTFKLIRYNPKRIRSLAVAVMLLIALFILSVPLFNLSELAAAVISVVSAVPFVILAQTWAAEKE